MGYGLEADTGGRACESQEIDIAISVQFMIFFKALAQNSQRTVTLMKTKVVSNVFINKKHACTFFKVFDQ